MSLCFPRIYPTIENTLKHRYPFPRNCTGILWDTVLWIAPWGRLGQLPGCGVSASLGLPPIVGFRNTGIIPFSIVEMVSCKNVWISTWKVLCPSFSVFSHVLISENVLAHILSCLHPPQPSAWKSTISRKGLAISVTGNLKWALEESYRSLVWPTTLLIASTENILPYIIIWV